MAFVQYNPNPVRKLVGDCVIRAISKVTNQDWETTYMNIVLQGYSMHDMPSSNDVWGTYLAEHGFKRYVIPDTCPNCYTVAQFCEDNPGLTGILATGTHVIAVDSGNYFDTWDSGSEIPIFYWRRE
jgi:hypothetical protein